MPDGKDIIHTECKLVKRNLTLYDTYGCFNTFATSSKKGQLCCQSYSQRSLTVSEVVSNITIFRNGANVFYFLIMAAPRSKNIKIVLYAAVRVP